MLMNEHVTRSSSNCSINTKRIEYRTSSSYALEDVGLFTLYWLYHGLYRKLSDVTWNFGLGACEDSVNTCVRGRRVASFWREMTSFWLKRSLSPFIVHSCLLSSRNTRNPQHKAHQNHNISNLCSIDFVLRHDY